MTIKDVTAAIRRIPDFPAPGIVYIDITPLLQNQQIFAYIIELLAANHLENPPDYVAALDARGFIFGGALACQLGCGFIPIRKKGKLPHKTICKSYDLEYGSAEIEIHQDAIQPGNRVLLVDDLLATGGTATAACELLKELGAHIVEVAFVVELGFLAGKKKLHEYNVHSLIVE